MLPWWRFLSRMAQSQAPEYLHMVARLREARNAAKLTQAQVAQRLGKPQSYVSKVETGERRIDPIELAQFAQIYRVKDLWWFVLNEGEV